MGIEKESGHQFRTVLTALASILLIIGLLVFSIETFALNSAFFQSEYAKLGTAEDIGISEDDLAKATQTLLDYTSGKIESLDMQAKIQDEMQEVFGQREKDHMVDVKALYLGARSVRTWSLIAAVVLLVIAFLIGRGKTPGTLCKSFLGVSAGFLVVVGAIAVYAAIDFTNFWISFHHIFFAGNDLWLLDPATDVLIQMVPEQFFSDLVARIIIRFVSIFLTLNIAAAVGLYIVKRKKRKAQVQEA
jgi:integral membrane protein (TIGR01906 family)